MIKPRIIRAVIAALLTLLVIDIADARKRRHERYEPEVAAVTPDQRATVQSREHRERRRSSRIVVDDIVPPDWRLQPTEPNSQGKRFASSDGSAWLAIYKAAADPGVTDHLKSVAFPGGDETLTYIQGERSQIAVAG